MSSEVSAPKRTTSNATKRGRRGAESKNNALDARRKLEERLEDRRLERELEEFDFEYG